MLYHGTNIGGLRYIQANSKSHTTGKSVAYFTEDRCYALVCCREREFNFVTMGLREDGKQHYFERFPDQLRVLYDVFMADAIHPTKAGYRDWWLPKFYEVLSEVLLGE